MLGFLAAQMNLTSCSHSQTMFGSPLIMSTSVSAAKPLTMKEQPITC